MSVFSLSVSPMSRANGGINCGLYVCLNAGSSGSDSMPLICDLHFVKTFIQVCNLEKVTFEQKYSVHLSR